MKKTRFATQHSLINTKENTIKIGKRTFISGLEDIDRTVKIYIDGVHYMESEWKRDFNMNLYWNILTLFVIGFANGSLYE